ncbi:MAG TPA: pyrroloquinoline quinone biosynthesis peptide chaperone PqqD [Gemmatimonadaceae bacterium]|jgi:pyrroloquinoline quinone biosynthesis protein D|nr:pyrroloquinoline quinone biosynthesis peptide chaperone PqqD [Gemmatimonadaceae bacterium]
MTTLASTFRPALWRLARLDFDPVRQRRVLLYPEGAILLNDTAAEILDLCDGTRTIGDIAAELGRRYHADVAQDVSDYLSQLVEREVVRDAAP